MHAGYIITSDHNLRSCESLVFMGPVHILYTTNDIEEYSKYRKILKDIEGYGRIWKDTEDIEEYSKYRKI